VLFFPLLMALLLKTEDSDETPLSKNLIFR
jgi:hypothetical protein